MPHTIKKRYIKSYLAQMPKEWLTKMYQASCQRSDDTIMELLTEIPPNFRMLKTYLTD